MRVLSVQSHVVHGYVGNKAATLPLQLLGYDVDPINTVHFSNHTGYPTFTGTKLSSSQFRDIVFGLEKNGILGQYTIILTGYIGNHEVLADVIDLCKKLKSQDLFIAIDPVMGDNGSLYVQESYPELYRKLIEYADIITPNGFEAE
jgi:pyridoxine kinase